VALLLHACGGSVYLLMRHLQSIEDSASLSGASIPRASFASWEDLLFEVGRLHRALLEVDHALAERFTPSNAQVEPVARPNETKQQLLLQQRQEAGTRGSEGDKAALPSYPAADKIAVAAHLLLRELMESRAASGQVAPVPAPESEAQQRAKACADAHVQLLGALSFPKAQLFCKAVRPVVVREVQLDALLRATYSAQAEADEEARAARGGGPQTAAEWAPHPSQVSAALRLIRGLDSAGLHFASWSSFLREYRARVAGEKRVALLSALSYPRCKLFSQATSSIEIDDAALDRIMQQQPPSRSPSPGVEQQSLSQLQPLVPLRRVLAAIAQLDAANTKVASVDELLELLRGPEILKRAV